MQSYIVGILAFGMISGIFSPFRVLMQIWLINFVPAFFVNSPAVFQLIVSLFTSTIVIMVAGVPAALFERFTGRSESDRASMWIWLAATAILSLPAVIFAFGSL